MTGRAATRPGPHSKRGFTDENSTVTGSDPDRAARQPGSAGPQRDARGHQAAATIKEQKPWGIAGDAAQVDRTIELRMSDQMRFTPDHLQIRQGETIRFIHRNDG